MSRGALSEGDFRYTLIAAINEPLPERVLGKCCLNKNLAAPRFAPGTASNLHDRLRHALIRSKIRAEESLVRIDDAHQSNVFAAISPQPVRIPKMSLRPSGALLMATPLFLPRQPTESRPLQNEEAAG